MKQTTFNIVKYNGEIPFIELYNKLQVLFNSAKNGTYTITIKEYRKTRSQDQNAYLWLCLNIISQETGHTPQQLHDIYCNMFLKSGETTYKGKTIEIVRGTSKLDTQEFSEFMDKVIADAAEMGIKLPNPADPLIEEYYKQCGL